MKSLGNDAGLTPPQLTVAEAGLLMHHAVGLPETAGTLLELGLLGALQIRDEDGKPQVLVLVDAALATHPHQRALLKALFPLLQPGESRALRRGRRDNTRLIEAQKALQKALREEVASSGWYRRMPSPGRRGLLPASRGRLSPEGQALRAEVVGFSRDLAATEAGQLTTAKLVRLLPWAMGLGLDDHWNQLINDAEADRWQPEPPPKWWTAAGMFRLGKFRRGIAAFIAGVLAIGNLPGYAQFYDPYEPRYDDGFIGHDTTNDIYDTSTDDHGSHPGFTHDTSSDSY